MSLNPIKMPWNPTKIDPISLRLEHPSGTIAIIAVIVTILDGTRDDGRLDVLGRVK